MNERELALGRFTILKKQVYELGVKAQSMTRDIQQETESFLSEKDFSEMDFKKVEALSKELQLLQADYKDKIVKMIQLNDTFNF